MLGFALLLLLISIILLLQQYSRHMVFSWGTLMFDIKQYSALIVALISYLTYRSRQKNTNIQ
jgi:amino acid permease